MEFLDWTIITIYIMALFGFAIAGRRAKSIDDFAVGSRQIHKGVILATLAATYIGPGYAIGLANKAAEKGLMWCVIFFAFSLQTILIGLFIAPKLRLFDKAYTLGDVMAARYGKIVKLITGILSVVFLMGVIGAIANASGHIISSLTGIPFFISVIISMAVVVIYSAIGGIKTVIVTDVLQFIVLAICIPAVIFYIGGVKGNQFVTDTISAAIIQPFSGLELFGLFFSFLLGETLAPPYAIRILAAKDPQHAKKGFINAGFFSILWFITCGAIGILGAQVLPAGSENVFVGVLKTYLPVGLSGLAIAALISIVMSTQDSLINAASVSFSNDILAVFENTEKFKHHFLLIAKIVTVVIGITAVVIALFVQGIIPALLICYTLWAPTIVVPLVLGTLSNKFSPLSGLTSIIAGGVATALWQWGLNTPWGIPTVIVGITANIITFFLVHVMTKNMTFHGWLGISKYESKTISSE